VPRRVDADGDGKPSEPVPLVLLVHGGPWGRDSWGYDPYHQWLQDRGYAVLSVNFRGSAGLTKKLVNAGDRQWAAAMHDDLIDAVKWAVDGGIARSDKVAIMGTSYGGYATLVGLTFTPKVFACGVDVVGPSNLVTLLETIPPYWETLKSMFARRVGDVSTPEGRELLRERSPLTHVAKIERPLLIGQGANDPRVKQAESDQIVAAMQAAKIPVTYVLFPDEGHGFARPTNQLAFTAVTEAFLGTCLGGVHEPFGDDFDGSTITVPAGADHIEGLAAALAKR
jgi:dipeptidyl aminopeptidase/acylaminoacyl peptidase